MEPKIPQLQTWVEKRRTTIQSLVALADVLDQQQRKSDIAGVAGSSTAVVGSVVSIGAALAPATGGAAMVPGLVLGVGGSVASLGSKLLKQRKVKEIMSETQKLIDADRKETLELEAIVRNLYEAEKSVIAYFEGLVDNELPQQQPPMLKQDNPDHGKKTGINVKQVATTAAMNAPMVLQKGIQLLRRKNLLNIRSLSKMMNTGKSGGTAVLKAAEQVGPKAMNIGRAMKIGGLAVSAALLPFDIIDLVQSSLSLHRGESHEVSIEVKAIAERLEHEVVEVQVYLRTTVKDMNNLIILIKQIKQNTCPANLEMMLNKILKKLLVGKKVLKAFHSCDIDGDEILEDTIGIQTTDKLAGILVYCAGFKKSFLRELATVIWIAWKLEGTNFAFLQNTSSFEFATRLWTLFGVSVNTFGQTSNRGVSVLFPLQFQGDVVCNDEFRDESDVSSDWNGRCIVVIVKLKGQEYTLVNMLAPEDVLDRKLFIQNATIFVKKHATGSIILGANFRGELPTMTTQIRKRVGTRTPLAFIEALMPYREVSEYLINRPKHMDAPNLLMYNMCKDLTVIDCRTLDINWSRWDCVAMSTEDYSSQIKPLQKLGLSELWLRKNGGVVEFSSVKKVGHRVVTCGQNLEFFVSADLADDIHDCRIDHCLRFLGFLHQSVITFTTG